MFIYFPTLSTKLNFKMFLVIFLFFSSLYTHSVSSQVKHAQVTSKISVMGVVYCDICSNNSFSRHSFYIQGAEVKIICKFNARSPRTEEQVEVSVNRTTNKSGIYMLDIPAVDGIQCAEEAAIMSVCEATLLSSSYRTCNLPGIKTASDQIAVKTNGQNVCVYSLNPLSYKPTKRDVTLCSGV